ncbi:MAG TPA: transporter substrate-binding domain-containing protein [Candidatus Galloscillospira excrementipullorum]|nr:transporter substrate-binding domain-containing protein [Candidatus Galloscillospira excrementipullorum]
MKKLLTFLLALTLLFSLFACNSTGEEDGQENGDSNQNGETAQTSGDLSRIDKIKQEGTLRIGTSADYPPYEFHTEIDGVDTIVGFDIALCQYIADDLGVELEITDMSFDSLLISLQQDKFDIVAAGMSPDEERLKAADFTDKIFESEQSIILRKADVALYPTTAELAGASIGVQKGTIQEGIAEGITDKVVKLTKLSELITELKTGKVDAVCIDYPCATAYVSGNDDLIVSDIEIEYEGPGTCLAVQKGETEWVEYLNGIIQTVNEDGTMDQFIAEASMLADASLE